MRTKQQIIKKTLEVGGYTFLSRIFGIAREMLMVRYLGATILSDAFLTAFKIPNSLRKIFAEGALSAAFVPVIVHTVHKNGKQAVNSMMTLAFLIFEGLLLFVVAAFIVYAKPILGVIVPGFSPEKIAIAVPYLQIMMPLILFLSSNALLAGALQSVGHFSVPASSPVLLNIIFIGGLIACLSFNLTVESLCWTILAAGLVQFILHLAAYIRLGFGFEKFSKQDFTAFGAILVRFLLCLATMSVMEIGLFIDTSFASYLEEGSISLMYYGYRFMGIPLGVFAVAFSTILLPHFSKVSVYAPKRLSFYLLESAKFIFAVTIPVALLMTFFSHKIFLTLFLSKKFTLLHVQKAAQLLCVFLSGLFFFSFNKILLNMYYALHETLIPALVATGGTVLNILLNIFLIHWQAPGLAWATVISGIMQTFFMMIILAQRFDFKLYLHQFMQFVRAFLLQMGVHCLCFIVVYRILTMIIRLFPEAFALALQDSILFWVWVGPLSLFFLWSLYMTRKQFNVQCYFLE